MSSSPGSSSVDVVVVGAGVVGLVTAALLESAGAQCLVLDRHDVGGVVTRGSTAKLTALQGTSYQSIESHHGLYGAMCYAAASTAGVAGLRSLIADRGIECSLTEAPAITYATTGTGLARVRAEWWSARRAGLDVAWCDEIELGVRPLGGVRLERQAHLDPGELCEGLASTLSAATALCPGVSAMEIKESARGCVVSTSDGRQLHCGHVVLATLGPVHDPLYLAARSRPSRSYAIAAEHPDPPLGMYISADESVRSVRPAVLQGRNAVIVAGNGHWVGDELGRSDPWADLEGFAVDVLGAGRITHKWSAHDLVPSDDVPFIGPMGPGARCWVASGFRKWGVSTAWVAGDLIAAGVDGRSRAWSPVFDPTRIRSSITADLARGAARSAAHLASRLGGSPPTAQGRRTVCTHMGCSLVRNSNEDTWDCPCHGSRFEPDGTVISGPAAKALRAHGRRRR